MTEDEAKERRCPMQLSEIAKHGRCIGAVCMAWREVRVPMRDNYRWDDEGRPTQIVNGFCGLAGAPQ